MWVQFTHSYFKVPTIWKSLNWRTEYISLSVLLLWASMSSTQRSCSQRYGAGITLHEYPWQPVWTNGYLLSYYFIHWLTWDISFPASIREPQLVFMAIISIWAVSAKVPCTWIWCPSVGHRYVPARRMELYQTFYVVPSPCPHEFRRWKLVTWS
uniref:Uncharacterized protein n=1 Tax=Morchella importuna TaxID=1174673 RepID=A0A650AFD5_9PEZI|nr:hypothetical protein [Morchella importuna]QGN66753.1 hypothetical protein [Morchella importuna]